VLEGLLSLSEAGCRNSSRPAFLLDALSGRSQRTFPPLVWRASERSAKAVGHLCTSIARGGVLATHTSARDS